MFHTHEHHSHSATELDETNVNKAIYIGIFLNVLYVIIQFGVGIKINSLSLISDAGHNFLDVGGLALSLIAFKLLKSKETNSYTYGYKKFSILASLFNAVLLLVSVGIIGYEAIMRIKNPAPLPGITIAIVALVGILVNGGSALLFYKGKEKDLNIKGAFLHLLADALFSLGIVIGGIIIYFTQWYIIDTILSVIICIVIVLSTWSLFKDSLKLTLDGVPNHIDMEQVRAIANTIPEVKDFHHIHVWAISTSESALTGHVVVENTTSLATIHSINQILKDKLLKLNIAHSTIEFEIQENSCKHSNC